MTTEEEAKIKIQIDSNTQTLDSLTQKFEKLTTVIDDAGKKLYILVEESKKLGEIKNPSFVSNTPVGSFSVSKNASPEIESLVKKTILANSRYVEASSSREKNEGFASLTRAEAQKLKAQYSQIYAEAFSRNSRTNAELADYNKDLIKAKAELAKARSKMLQEGANGLYNHNFEGSVASALFGQGQRFTYRGGFTGLMARFGSKMSTDQDSFFGSMFGKLNEKSSGFNINNWFGGLLAKGTKAGLGINAGGLVLGGAAVAAAAAAAALVKLTGASLDAYGSMQKLSVGLEVVYGSKTESDQAFRGIQNYAIKSPYGVTQTTEMAVLLKQSGVYSSKLLDTLEMIGDVSSGNEEKMKRIANNYAQIQAIGHASMLDMRQFAYAGIPIYKEVAEYMNVSQEKLRSMISDGKVTSDIIEGVFKKMTSEGGTFYGAVEKGAMTYSARKQNYEDKKSLALSNIGQSIYNFGSSQLSGNGIGSAWLSFKEGFQSLVSNVFSQINTVTDYASAIDSTNMNKTIEKILHSTENIEENNSGSSTGWRNNPSVIAILKNVSEESIRAAKVKEFNKETKFDGKQKATDKDLQDAEKALEEYKKEVPGVSLFQKLSKRYASYLSFIGSVGGPVGFPVAVATYLKTGKSFLSPISEMKDLEKPIKALEGALKDSYTATERYNSIMNYFSSKDNKKVDMARAVMVSDISSFQNKSLDNAQSINSNQNSLSSRTDKYDLLYASSPEGKAEQEKKDEEDFAKYSKEFDKARSMVNDNGTLKYDVLSKENLIFAIKSGILQARENISIDPEHVIVNQYDSPSVREEKFGNIQSLKKNVDNLISGLTNNKFNPWGRQSLLEGKDNSILVGKLKKVSSILNVKKSKDLTANFSNDLSQNVFDLISYAEDTDFASIIGSLFQKSDVPNKSKYSGKTSGSGSIKNIPPLWKRIFASATGWDAEQMIGMNGNSAMMGYVPFQNRGLSQGMINGMVISGLSSQQIADKLKYTNYTNNINGGNDKTHQIDWNATAKSFLDMSRSSSMTAEEMSSLYESVKGQSDVFDKIKTTMFTTGEDWANIKGTLSNSQEIQLENAYAGNTYSAIYKTGSKAGTTEEVELKDGKWIVKATGELVSNIKELSLETESILNPLDALSINMKNLESTMSISNNLYQKASELKSSSMSLNIETALLREGLGKIGVNTENTSVVSKEIVDAMTPLFKIANTDKEERDRIISEYKKNNEGKAGYVEINQETLDFLDGMKGLRGEALYNKIIELFSMDNFKSPFGNFMASASENTSAQEENERAKFDSNFMNKYMNFMGSKGFLNAQNSEAYLKNGNSLSDQIMSNKIGLSGRSFNEFADRNIKDAFEGNKGQVTEGLYDYVSNFFNNNPQLGKQNLNPLKNALDSFDFEETKSALNDLGLDTEKVFNGFMKMSISVADTANQLHSLSKSLDELLKSTAISSLTGTFETFGETLVSGSDASESLQKNFQKIGQSLFAQMGQMLASAGLELIIGSGGVDNGKIATGLALMGAGGLSSLLSGMMTDSSSSDNEAEKLKQIKEDMADLLKQARNDAVYYENTLRHQTAISADEAVSSRVSKVGDAIIKPNGTIYTNPDDYLYAATDPKKFIGGGSSPNVTFSIVNNGQPVAVESRKQTNTDDGIDIQLVIKNVVAEGIARGEFNDAMSLNNGRNNGWSSVK